MEEMESKKKKKPPHLSSIPGRKIEHLNIEKRKMPKEILQCVSHLL